MQLSGCVDGGMEHDAAGKRLEGVLLDLPYLPQLVEVRRGVLACAHDVEPAEFGLQACSELV